VGFPYAPIAMGGTFTPSMVVCLMDTSCEVVAAEDIVRGVDR